MDRAVVLNTPICLRQQVCSTSSRPASRAGCGVRMPALSRRDFAGAALFAQQQQVQAASRRQVISCAYGEVAAEAQAAATPALSIGLPENIESYYLFGQILGQGAYGTVRYGYNKHTNMECAVKVLPKSRNGQPVNVRTLRKLERELQVHSALQDCHNVVSLYDAYEDEQHVYLVLEFCRGKTLEQYLVEHGPLPEKDVALIIYEVLKVVATCHANSILHGDVKAANFVFARKAAGRSLQEVAASSNGPWLKAIDFGCSQRYRPGNPFQMRVGTPVFMAPEVFMRDYGLEADMWSVGILFYQLMAARFPFWDTLDECRSRTLDEVMKAVIVDDIDFSYGPWAATSGAGLDLVQRLLTRDPTQRISAADALRHPWFVEQGVAVPAAAPAVAQQQQQQQQHASNIVPLAGAAAVPPPVATEAAAGKLAVS